jgi:hypothetical protein
MLLVSCQVIDLKAGQPNATLVVVQQVPKENSLPLHIPTQA